MPRSREIPLALRDQAVGLARTGKTYREIATILNIHYSTVYYVIRKYKDTGSTINHPRKGRPKSISLRASGQIKSIMKRNRTVGLRGITEMFNVGKDVSVSEKTVSRCLHNQGFYARRPCKKLWVSNRNRLKRLAYYKIHKAWKIHDWKSIIFSDESKFNLFHSNGRIKVWRQSHERYLPECTQKTIQGFGGLSCFGDVLPMTKWVH